MAYVTTDEVKTYLGISGSTEDNLIAALILSATEAIDTYLNVTTLEETENYSEKHEHPVSAQD